MWDSIAPPRVQRLKLSDRRSEEQFGLFSRNIMNDKKNHKSSPAAKSAMAMRSILGKG